MKKLLTLLLALTMLQGLPVFASAATFADTEGLPCDKAVSVLSALGIVEGKGAGAYEPESTLTRAEMATIILRTQNMADNAVGMDIFTDVPNTHWAYANIASAYQLGIVNGTSATTFEPDAGVTYEQAVKMMVAALGYTVKAEAQGGYPTGYLTVAAQLDILKGVSMDKDMNRGSMAILLYNSLEVEMLQKTSYGDDAYEYDTAGKLTLLETALKTEHKTGVITATFEGAFAVPSKTLAIDEVVVDGTVYKVGETNAVSLLGARVDIYYKEDKVSGDKVLVCAIPANGTEILEIAATDIEKADASKVVYIDAEGKDQDLTIAGAQLLLNGTLKANLDSLRTLTNGAVRFVSNNGSVAYIICETYTNYVVEKIDEEKNTVYVKNGSPLVIDLEDEKKPVALVNTIGNPIKLTSLMEWDIISVVKNEGSRIFRVIKSVATVEGKIGEKSENKVYIRGFEYTLANSGLSLGTIDVGTEGTFFLDFAGQIAAVDTSSVRGGDYAWLVSGTAGIGLGAKPELKIFTAKGEMKMFRTTETVRVNGFSVEQKDLLKPSMLADKAIWSDEKIAPLTDSSGAVVPQLLKIKTNTDGLISEIETAANKTKPTLSDEEKYVDEFSMDWYYHRPRHDANSTNGEGRVTEFDGTKSGDIADTDLWVDGRYPGSWSDYTMNYNGIFFGSFQLKENTPFFSIPYDVEKDEDYKIIPIDKTTILSDAYLLNTRCVSFYDIDEDFMCNAMVMHTYLDKSSATDQYDFKGMVGVIKKISHILGEDGETKQAMTIGTKNGEIVVPFESDDRALYAFAGNDITADDKWFTTNDGLSGTRIDLPGRIYDGYDRVERDVAREYFNQRRKGSKIMRMYIEMGDLAVGDVLQFAIDENTGDYTSMMVIFRHEYPGYTLKSQGQTGAVKMPSRTNMFPIDTGFVTLNGYITQHLGDRIRVETTLLNASGVSSGETYTYTFISEGPYYRFDLNTQEFEEITIEDLREGEEIFMYVITDTQEITIAYTR